MALAAVGVLSGLAALIGLGLVIAVFASQPLTGFGSKYTSPPPSAFSPDRDGCSFDANIHRRHGQGHRRGRSAGRG